MKERPILFNQQMVRAINDGGKTQTRRIASIAWDTSKHWGNFDCWTFYKGMRPSIGFGTRNRGQDALLGFCPYGQPGDRLWVRETFTIEHSVEHDQEPPHKDGRPVKWSDDPEAHRWLQPHYRATDQTPALSYEDSDEPQCRWKPSIHMPRWASRILLEVVSVRVERLQDISEADAIAEGVRPEPHMLGDEDVMVHVAMVRLDVSAPVARYVLLWDSINNVVPNNWNSNPWVWVVEFKKV